MCVINVNRVAVLALDEDDRSALREFAEKRLARAATEHAREFWRSLVEACMPTEEYEAAIKARIAAYDAAQAETPKE